MKIFIELSPEISLQFTLNSIDDAPSFFSQDNVRKFFVNDLNFISYVEMNDEEFRSYVFDFFEDEDQQKFWKKVQEYDFTSDMFKKYLAHVFNIPISNILFIDEMF